LRVVRAVADRAGDRRAGKEGCAEACRRITATLEEKGGKKIDVGVICGSGLDDILSLPEKPVDINYRDIPGLENLCGGDGSRILRWGRLGSKNVLIFGRRIHIYEGYTAWESALPVRILSGLGAGSVILSCASGSLRRSLSPGSILLIKDHLNLAFTNPGRGLLLGPSRRFVDLCESYDPELIRLAQECALEKAVRLREGVLVSVTGPSFETRAEARMLRNAGADIVSMSMVAEAIVARMMNLRVMGLSAVTNYVPMTGTAEVVTHEEVLSHAREMSRQISAIVEAVIGNM
jgi:purine-nucleoside phosphorylase